MKRIKTVLLVVAFLFLLGSCGNGIKISADSFDYEGKDYKEVIRELREAGFENIETEIIEDLTFSGSVSDGAVEKIIIDGSGTFIKGESFSPDVKIVVTYHAVKKIAPPFSAGELQETDYESIGKSLENAGFSNVKAGELYDLDPDQVKADYINQVSIDGKTSFDTKDKFPCDAVVLVVCHRPYEKYTVQLHVECLSNLIFSRYDIDIWLDDEKKELLGHGQQDAYEFRVREGEHTFIFAEEGSDTVNGKVNVDVSCDMEMSYKLSCFSDKVGVEQVYVDRKIDLSEGEVKLAASASEYKHMNYKDIIAALGETGFTNIKTDVLYDIFWGITPEGESDKVTIDGKDDFKRGEVYAKDVEVIVTYHMPEKDDPKNQEKDQQLQGEERTDEGQKLPEEEGEETEATENQEGNTTVDDEDGEEILTADNCEELAELLSTEDYEITKAFASKYRGRQIEFDGYVAGYMNYSAGSKVYKTRYNYLIYVGDNGQEHFTGPSILFENITYSSFNFTGEKPDYVSEGLNLHIIAEITGFKEEQGLLLLKPVSTSVRQR